MKNTEELEFEESKMKISEKDILFRYMIYKLIKWFEEKIDSDKLPDFTRLKAMKLLFFVSVANHNKDGLLDIFDDFHAMSYGPVEGEIFSRISIEDYYSPHFTLTNMKIVKGPDFDKIPQLTDEKYRMLIDCSISILREINETLILHSPSDLINISFQWNSWQERYNIAQSLNKMSENMEKESIIEDSYNLSNFDY